MKLTPKDRKVIAAFIDGDAQTSAHLTTDGQRLDGRWMGGNHIAFFTTGGDIAFTDLGSKAAQTVQRAIARAAPGSLDESARYVLAPVAHARLRSSEARARRMFRNPLRNTHLRPGDWVEDHYGRRGSVVKAYPRDRYDVAFVGYGGQAIQLRGEYLTKINPRKNARRNGPVTNLRGPSVATLQHLPATGRAASHRATATLTKTQAQELKTLLNEGKPRAALTLYDTMSRSNGVEYISGSSGGLYYVNHGDTYDTTLIYDTGKRVVLVGSWGDIVERDRRFRGDW